MARIVHWGKYYPPNRGGIESVTASVAEGAAGLGHEVIVICFSKGGSSSRYRSGGAEVICLPERLCLSSQPLSLKYMFVALREAKRSDIIHLHAPNILGAVMSMLLRRRSKLLVHWHSDIINKGLLGYLVRPLEWALLRRADVVICTSRQYASASNAISRVLQKVRIVPLGVQDCQKIAKAHGESARNLKEWLNGRRYILSVGRLVPYKGHHVLIDAARSLPEEYGVVIVGTGPLRRDLCDQVRSYNLEGRVLITGELDEAGLDIAFRNASVFCLPSLERSEAFGVVLLEAMAYGLPVVASDIAGSGVSWVNTDGLSGINVTPGNSTELARAVLSILGDNEQRMKLSRSSRQRYISEFTKRQFIDRMMVEYDSLLSMGRMRGGDALGG